MSARLPAIYLPHGGGPWPFVELGFGPPGMYARLEDYLRHLVVGLKEKPKAVLVVSAHWEASVPTVMTSPHPPMLYDYFGFPEASYHIQWPAPGAPELGARVRALLEKAGFRTAEDKERGYDHGTFVPLKLALPNADLPILQLSLVKGLDPKAHVAIGRALAPLRDEGILFVGSGMSYHNLRAFNSRAAYEAAKLFDSWLAHAMSQAPRDREQLLVEWENAPAARAAHPREEHLLPLHVMAGAGLDDAATMPFRDRLLGADVSAVHFG